MARFEPEPLGLLGERPTTVLPLLEVTSVAKEQSYKARPQELYSQHFILFVTYKWVQ